MTDHAKVLREIAVDGAGDCGYGLSIAEIAACAAGADAIEECERLRAENARLRELGNTLRYAALRNHPVEDSTTCPECNAGRAWDEEVG